MAFAFLTPFFFLKGGMNVSLRAVAANLGVLGLLIVAKMLPKLAGVYPLARRYTAPHAAFTTLLLAGLLARPVSTQPPGPSSSPTGAGLFSASCAGCHSGDDARAPAPEVLRGRSPQAILAYSD